MGMGDMGVGSMGPAGMFMHGPGDDANSEKPHTFLVEVDDSADISKRSERSEIETERGESVSTERRDKGKGKARDNMEVDGDNTDSTTSIIADETPKKHPVHVYDVSDAEADAESPGTIAGNIHRYLCVNRDIILTLTFVDESNASYTAKAVSPKTFPDPPLEATGEPAEQTISLTNDLAAFLNNLSSVLSGHPELAEEISTIVRNAWDGSYWASHRKALTRAAPPWNSKLKLDWLAPTCVVLPRKRLAGASLKLSTTSLLLYAK